MEPTPNIWNYGNQHASFYTDLISKNPGNSSNNFENTIKLLENQVKRKRGALRHCSSLSSITEEPPSYLELELEARDRLRNICDKNCTFIFNEHDDAIRNYIYYVARKNGQLYIKSKRTSTGLSNINKSIDDDVLSGERMENVVRCYDDIEAVTRLLQEKEKDLELTVQIGKELLAKNVRLERKVSDLETELKSANENLAQVNHELYQKNELINILTENDEPSNGTASPSASKSVNFDFLQRKISVLETENRNLQMDVQLVVNETDEVEEHEKRLISELTEQLSSTHYHFESINLELERYKEENKIYNEQIYNLTHRLAEAELRLHELLHENEETISLLSVTKENQNMLAAELVEFKLRYQETLNVLTETQEALRLQRKRSQPMMRSSYIPGITSQVYNPDSLQSELMESSMFSDGSLDSGIQSDGGNNNQHPKGPLMFQKIFDTVKCASNSSVYSKTSSMDELTDSTTLKPRMSCSLYSSASSSDFLKPAETKSSVYSSIYGAQFTIGPNNDENMSEGEETCYQNRTCPGVPGAKDLELALRKLSSAEVLARRSQLSYGIMPGSYSYDEPIQTPESISTLSSHSSSTSFTWRCPKKLEIVKPMDGSHTLNHWNRLATPTMGNLLHDNPNIKVKGEKTLDELGMQLYSLTDLEEDVADDHQLGRNFDSSSCIYTYTNSTVLHPDDGSVSITFSLPASQMSSRMESRQPTAPPTPRTMSRRNSCSTFSVSNGLASMLNERGIRAVTPSCLNTPVGQNFSPTVTPYNSPTEGMSPTHSRSPPEAVSLTSFLTSSAGLLRKKIIGEPAAVHTSSSSSNGRKYNLLEKKAKLRSIRILGQKLGLENIIITTSASTGIHPLAINNSNIYTRYHSPMAQLTSLKHLQECKKSLEATDMSATTDDDDQSKASASLVKDAKMKQKVQRQKSRRVLNGSSGQRKDLGTVKVPTSIAKEADRTEKSIVGGFVGSISSLLFGRKGGLL